MRPFPCYLALALILGCTHFGIAATRFLATVSPLAAVPNRFVAYDGTGNLIDEVELADQRNWFLRSDGQTVYTREIGWIYSQTISDAPSLFTPFVAAGAFSTFTVDELGNLYTFARESIGGTWQTKVNRWNNRGELTLEFHAPDVNADYQHGVAVDRQGRIYLLSAIPGDPIPFQGTRVSRYSATGHFETATVIADLHFAWHLGIDHVDDRLYLSLQEGGVAELDISGDALELERTLEFPHISAQFDFSVDPLTGHFFVAGIGGAFEYDRQGNLLNRNLDGADAFSGIVAVGAPIGESGDVNGDQQLNAIDLNAMTRALVSDEPHSQFDFDGDGEVDAADRDVWLAMAGETNLGAGQAYQPGDANLDGRVDGQDFVAWSNNRFTRAAAWSDGDFNSDGLVDGQDFIVWHQNRSGILEHVPEPRWGWWLGIVLALGSVRKRLGPGRYRCFR